MQVKKRKETCLWNIKKSLQFIKIKKYKVLIAQTLGYNKKGIGNTKRALKKATVIFGSQIAKNAVFL